MKNKAEVYEIIFTDYPDLVSVKELAKMLGIGITKAYELAKTNTIPNKRIDNQYKIPKVCVIDYFFQN